MKQARKRLVPQLSAYDRTKHDRLRRQFAAMSHQFNPRACNRRLGPGFEELNGICNRHNVLQQCELRLLGICEHCLGDHIDLEADGVQHCPNPLPTLEEWNTRYNRHWDRILAFKKEKIMGLLPGGQQAYFAPWLSNNQPEQKVVRARHLVRYKHR